MSYNLIDEQWIPVCRRSGRVDRISPAELVDPRDPPLRVASARPDFDGALLEFLIGLLQTAAAPASEREWERAFDSPPAVAALKKKLDVIREAFFLDGDGPRFMQDLTVGKDAKAESAPIGALLIDRVGEAGLEDGPTLFAKPGLFGALGYPATAAALLALQTYAPAGGAGHRTSLRGGGPLTTIILGDTLWATVWLNVLPGPVFERRVPGDASATALHAKFPWLRPTRTSEKEGGRTTTPQDVHPLQHYWGLPRRFRLEASSEPRGSCAIDGEKDVPVFRSFKGRPSGTNYKGEFRHPLTPYSFSKANEPWNPKKGSADGLPYRDWPLLVTGSENRSPATVVSYFSTERRERVSQPRLSAFGYAMDNMKPLRWCRAETPLITVHSHLSASFAREVEALVAASEEVRKTLAYQLKGAWSDRPQDLDVLGIVNPAFWSRTEESFFVAVHAVKDAIERDNADSLTAARTGWLSSLHEAALALFDGFVSSPVDLAAPDLQRAVIARRVLERLTAPTSGSLRKLLGLATEEGNQRSRPRRPRKEQRT